MEGEKPLSAYRHLSPYRERLVKGCDLIAIAALLSGIANFGSRKQWKTSTNIQNQ